MSNPESFIEEVSEELQRDKLFGVFKKYGWIFLLAVILIVGAAAANEYFKAQKQSQAEARGDALIAALDAPTEERIDLLANTDAGITGIFLEATAFSETGKEDVAANLYDKIINDQSLPKIYRDLAVFKSALLGSLGSDVRKSKLETLVIAGNALRIPASEQLAYIELETGNIDAAIAALQALLNDAEIKDSTAQRLTDVLASLGVSEVTTDAADDSKE